MSAVLNSTGARNMVPAQQPEEMVEVLELFAYGDQMKISSPSPITWPFRNPTQSIFTTSPGVTVPSEGQLAAFLSFNTTQPP